MFDADRIQRDREICDRATSGKWLSSVRIYDDMHETYSGDERIASEIEKPADAVFIAISRTELPAALDEIVRLQNELAESQRMARNARNELCQKCGKYRESHNGSCDWCKWKE